MSPDRIELVTGVCAVLYKPSDPERVLILKELQWKKLTGKLASQWGSVNETVERNGHGPAESHRLALNRALGCIHQPGEEITIERGRVLIPDDLDTARLCITRVSSPEDGAWVYAYACPVSEDFEAGQGRFIEEIGKPVWADARQILVTARGSERIKPFRASTYEVLWHHLAHLRNSSYPVGIYPEPLNLPPWEVYPLLAAGVPQSEALSRSGFDPRPLEESAALIHSLAARAA